MQPYRDLDRDSGVIAYESGPDFIRVEFHDGAVFLYTVASTGARAIAEMQRLAGAGDGLQAYINTHVKGRYARRER